MSICLANASKFVKRHFIRTSVMHNNNLRNLEKSIKYKDVFKCSLWVACYISHHKCF